MNDLELVNGIAGVIQRVYGDAAQVALGRTAAKEIWQYLTKCGVAAPDFVHALVAAAGGSVTIPRNLLEDPPRKIMVIHGNQFLDGSVTVKVER